MPHLLTLNSPISTLPRVVLVSKSSVPAHSAYDLESGVMKKPLDSRQCREEVLIMSAIGMSKGRGLQWYEEASV